MELGCTRKKLEQSRMEYRGIRRINQRHLGDSSVIVLRRATIAVSIYALLHSDTHVQSQYKACVPVQVRDSAACLLEVGLPVRSLIVSKSI